MAIQDILRAYCVVHYPCIDGFCNPDIECGYDIDDFQPCGSNCMNCVPAKPDESQENFIPL